MTSGDVEGGSRASGVACFVGSRVGSGPILEMAKSLVFVLKCFGYPF